MNRPNIIGKRIVLPNPVQVGTVVAIHPQEPFMLRVATEDGRTIWMVRSAVLSKNHVHRRKNL